MDGLSLNISQDRLSQLRQLFPEVFREDQIDFDGLKSVLGEQVAPPTQERYGLTWAGKYDAYREIQKQTTATLTPDRANSIEFDATDNIFIEGENLEVLRVLQKSYYGKVKMIYIDPPYNTGNDSFVYPDDYSERQDAYRKRTGITNEEGFLNKQDLWRKNSKENGQFHSVWLSMMFPRLFLARNLLKEDGVIFISIDDNEQANLKLLLDEVFGQENFVANVIWQKKYSPQNDAKWFSAMHDHILVYAKNKEIWRPYLLERTEEMNARYSNPDNDYRGNWKSSDLSVKTYSKEYDYSISTPTGRVAFPPKGGCWRVSRDKFNQLVEDDRIWFGDKGDSVPSIKRFLSEVKQGITPNTIWFRTEVGDNQEAAKEIKDLFDDLPFDTPKPSRLIKRILQLSTSDSENHIVMDFFAGSGTTAQAVMELNKQDGGNRRFILVQMPEELVSDRTYSSPYKTISSVSLDRIKRVVQRIKDEDELILNFQNEKTDLGVRSYYLDKSNFKQWDSKFTNETNILEQLDIFQQSVETPIKYESLLTELLLKAGITLNSVIEKIETDNGFFYYLPNREYCICLQDYTVKTHEKILKLEPQQVIVLNSLFKVDNFLSNVKLEFHERDIVFVLI